MTTQVLHGFARPATEEEHVDTVGNAAFGFWVYVMSDCLLFAALFATFVVLSHNFAGGPTGRGLFDLRYTLTETGCLLLSSVTYGFAMLAVHGGRQRRVVGWLLVTMLFGLGFLGMEVHEFYGMVVAGAGPQRSGFLSAFFTLVGTHGAHVTVGLVWMTVMLAQIAAKGLTTPVQSRLMRLGMFWHFLDIVWIGVFSVVYLEGMIR